MALEDIKERLKQAGLGHNESKIYLTLLSLGPCMAGKIAKEANIDRSASYDSLKALIKKGLVSYVIEANRKKFSANSPKRLIDFLKEKQDSIETILPQLNNLFTEQKEDSQVSMYKGTKGIKSVLEDLLIEAKGGENLVIDSSRVFSKKMPYYAPHYIAGLEKNKIKVRHLVRKGAKSVLHPSKTTTTRFFKNDMSETSITTNIYNDKIVMILWTEIPEAVVIKNKAAATAYKDYFEVLWATAKK
jgi:sugar-specific transcriptional regulator TrmB